jgi:hypothetical protein
MLEFKTEQDRTNALLDLQDKRVSIDSLAQIEEIKNAKVLEPDKDEEEEVVSRETVVPPKAEDKPAVTPVVTPEESFIITKDMIPDEKIRDRSGLEKPIWTYNKPEEIVKAIVNKEKHIRLLENDLLPRATQEGYDRAKAERDEEISKYKQEIEDLKKQKQATIEATKTTPVPPVNLSVVSMDEYNKAVEALSKFNPDSNDFDVFEYTKASNKVISLQNQVFKQDFDQLRKENETLRSNFGQFELTLKQQEEQKKAEIEHNKQVELRQKATDEWVNAAKSVDKFAKDSGFVTPYSFKDLTTEAQVFHQRLAQAWTGKPNVTQEEVEQAEAAYKNEIPSFINKVNEYGIQKPRDYDVWRELDTIDAIRKGWFTDPQTGRWYQRKDVAFPDLDSAYTYYCKITGKTRQQNIDQSNKIINAINKRDTGVVQMDTSKTVTDGTAEAFNLDQASKVLSDVDMRKVLAELRKGNKKPFEEYNRARVTLQLPPLEEAAYSH